MKRKIALILVFMIVSVLLLTGCPPILPTFPGYSGVKSVSNVEDIYNNYIIERYLIPESFDMFSMFGQEDYPKVFKSKNEENFREAVLKCNNLKDIGFESFTGFLNKSSNALFLSMYDLDAMAYLLDNGADANAADQGTTPLMLFANLGIKSHCDLLLEHGADINLAGKYGLRPLDCALISGNDLELIQYLVEKGAVVDETTLDAALYGNSGESVVLLDYLLMDINIHTYEDAYCHYENARYILQLLLQSGQQIELDPALQAAITGDSTKLKKILKTNREKIGNSEAMIPIDIFWEDDGLADTILDFIKNKISGPLDQYNFSEIQENLAIWIDKFSKKSNTDKTDAEQMKRKIYLNQLLFNVAAFGKLKDVEDIMENGPGQFLGTTNGQGLDIMSVAIKYNNIENVKYMEETFRFHTNEALDFAIRSNNVDAAKYLMKRGGKLPENNDDIYDDKFNLPLACIKPQQFAGSLLGDINIISDIFNGDLSDKQSQKHIAMLEFLKQNNFSYRSSDLEEAISYATEQGYVQILEYLLKNYGSPDLANKELSKAVNVESIKLFQQYGADVLKNNQGAECICLAASQKNFETLQYYLSVGADPNNLDKDGKTPLYYALVHGKFDFVKLLVDNGAQISAARLTDYEGNNMMANIISVNGSNSILDFFISSGYDISAQYKNGETPMTELVYECIDSYEQGGVFNPVDANPKFGRMIWELMKETYNESETGQNFNLAGFDNSEEFNEAWNELMHKKYLERIELLLQYKADPTIDNTRGKNAYNIAEEKGFDDIVKLFDDAGYKND